MSQYLKSLQWSPKTFGPDLGSGLTVALVSIPEGMAYAIVAGVDPERVTELLNPKRRELTTLINKG